MSRKENKKFLLEITILITFAALVVVLLLTEIRSQKNEEQTVKTIESYIASQQTQQPMYQWRGEITDVNDNALAVKVQVTDPSTAKRTSYSFTVNITNATRIVRINTTNKRTNTDAFYSQTTEVQKADLHNGNTVIVQSSKNANAQLVVDADLIYLINIK